MQLAQQLRAFERGGLAPRLECRIGGFDGTARFGLAGLRHGADLEAGGRVVDIHRLAAVGLHPFAVDEIGLPHEMAGFLKHGLASVRLTDGPVAEFL